METEQKIHSGSLEAKAGVIYDFTEITGSIDASGANTKTAFPKLATIGGYLDASGANTKTAFPKLATIGGSLDASGANTKTAFPRLTTIGGYLDASGANTKTAFPKLTTIGGYLYVRCADTKTAFPKLTTIGGYLDAYGSDTKTAFPKLTTIGGTLYAYGADTKTAFPRLTTIGGSLDASGANTKTAFPKLTTIGGTLYAYGADTKTAFPKLKSLGDESALESALKLVGLCKVDGILAKVINKRGGVSRVVIVGQTKQSYIVEREGKYAHGKTLAEARVDLLMKLGNRDTSQFKGWTTETKVTLEQIIVAYRTITRACGQGCSHFLASKNYPPKVTVGFIIEETKGAYGHEAFRNFFNK